MYSCKTATVQRNSISECLKKEKRKREEEESIMRVFVRNHISLKTKKIEDIKRKEFHTLIVEMSTTFLIIVV